MPKLTFKKFIEECHAAEAGLDSQIRLGSDPMYVEECIRDNITPIHVGAAEDTQWDIIYFRQEAEKMPPNDFVPESWYPVEREWLGLPGPKEHKFPQPAPPPRKKTEWEILWDEYKDKEPNERKRAIFLAQMILERKYKNDKRTDDNDRQPDCEI